MATKLKKSHKFTTMLITLCILVPAFLLTALYPRITSEVQKKEAESEAHGNSENYETTWELGDNFVNYAMEASYYLYGQALEEAHNEQVDYSVLNNFGWIDDYWWISGDARYYAEYHYQDDGQQVVVKKNADELKSEDTIGILTLEFDSQGYLANVYLEGDNIVYLEGYSIYEQAKRSVEQYRINVIEAEGQLGQEVDETQLEPKNFKIHFAIDSYSEFVWEAGYHYFYTSPMQRLAEVGAIWIVAAVAAFIGLAALLLPFFKKLETGWEKPFCMPFEVIVVCAIAAVWGGVGMLYSMAQMSQIEQYPNIEILGVPVTQNVQYGFLLAASFLGWAICFFLEYVAISSVRQFLCGPVYYLKNRLLIVRVFRWIKRKCIKLYYYVTDIDISEKLNSSIIKIVIANFVIISVCCVMWVFGVLGLLVYSGVLYILLRKYGEKVQKQYNSILNATEQMAEGNLKVTMEEDLGVLQPIGDSLEKVQQGFAKAVAEEAKSQNMKTELITNVSHDLKTPLTAIITYVDLLKKEDITEEERKSYVRTLEQKSQRLKALIEDLFEVSKAQSGNVKMNFMDVDVVNLIKQVRFEMADQLESSNLTFRWNLPEEKIMLSLDGQRTYRVFENLLSNALKYAMPYSRVYVDILQNESKVQIVFRNMSAQELDFEAERLTERFVRGDASRNSEGSGLGLAIAKSFVELQNGEFKIDVDGDLFKVSITWNK